LAKWIVLGMLGLSSFAANAQGIAWDELSRAEQRLLGDQESVWADLEPARQERIALGARRYLDMNRAERRAAQDRFERWRGLPDQRRDSIRERYRLYLDLSTDQQRRLRDIYRQFNRLPRDRQDSIRRQFRDVDRSRVQDRLRQRRLDTDQGR
jgi:hypothetical protein